MTFEQLKDIIVSTLNCDAESVTMEANLHDDLDADSLDAVELNLAIGDACNVSIPDEKLKEIVTVGDIFNCLQAELQK